MGHTASLEAGRVLTSCTPGVITRSVRLTGVPTLVVPHPRRGTFFITFHSGARGASISDRPSAYSVWTMSKFQIRGGVEFKGHKGPVSGVAVLTSELHEFELFSRICSDDNTDPCLAMADPVTAGEELLITTSLDGLLRVFDISTQACVLEFDAGEPLIGLALWPPTVVRQGILAQLGAIAGRGIACIATKSGGVIPLRLRFRNGVVSLSRIEIVGDIPFFDHFGHSLASVFTSVSQSMETKNISFLVANPSGVSMYRTTSKTPPESTLPLVGQSLLEDVPLIFTHVANRPLPAFRNGLSGAAFRTVHDSSQFVACGYDRIGLFDSTSFVMLWSSLGHRSIITALATSIDGRRFATGDLEGIIHVWEADSGTSLQEISGVHSTSVRNIHFIADDRFFMSTASDAKEMVRTVPTEDARHVLLDNVDKRVLPKEISSWFVSLYLAPSDILP